MLLTKLVHATSINNNSCIKQLLLKYLGLTQWVCWYLHALVCVTWSLNYGGSRSGAAPACLRLSLFIQGTRCVSTSLAPSSLFSHRTVLYRLECIQQ